MEIKTCNYYRIEGKIYMAMGVTDKFPVQRFMECTSTISHRVFPNIENMDVQEVSEHQADVYFQRSQVNPRNW